MNFITIMALIVSSTLAYSAPLILTSLGGVYSENSGIVNIGLEGIMTMGAFAAIVFNLTFAPSMSSLTPWVGALVGGIAGLIFSILHAVATINFHADHIISGTVLNIMAPPIGVFLIKALYDKGQTENITANFGYFSFPGLSSIPVIGPIFFKNTSAPAWIAIILAIFMWWLLYKTRFGLRLRSCGENPQAADTMGINVYKMRYIGVLTSGFMGGLGGAIFAEAIAGNFSISTIVGQGFMALAAVIFGKWNPIGAMLSSLFFGFAQSLSIIGNQLPVISNIPAVYMQIAPYVLTIIVLVLFLGKSVAPAADGVNYIKSK
ncbi:ABC transporter permease [Lactobacillus amylovorus]|jgi:simple sugar transport system permease protein|uniref:ABC transporter permease n=1 Tax=Lactobacillus amylovorus TaxID=1604 RepID=A0AAW6BCL0_LACAM|nr:ABC transporter permease [Lactobacillus amylovorus]MDA6090129.1 ABC transporter permease [Lactobacillus amylovorus]MDB6222499.1 ABC transporter permease [Lactobacillus amylovorus]MDB6238932.1 ABC transporter permease [Lactobacillus amylovorus]MDB6247426.1 ABC transporter permease [Lactobacillus amylovorus]